MSIAPFLTPRELEAELAGPNPPKLLDVREDEERDISVLTDHAHIPLGELEARCEELDKSQNWVVYCRTGNRSNTGALILMQHGFEHVRNLATGINGWATTIDPELPTY